MRLAIDVVRLISREDEGLAGLALVSSIRKRLMNPHSELAADEMQLVRLTAADKLLLQRSPSFLLRMDLQMKSAASDLFRLTFLAVLCVTCSQCRVSHAASMRAQVQRRGRAPCQAGC